MKSVQSSFALHLPTRITIGFIIALLVLGGLGWLSIRSINDSVRTERILGRTHHELTEISNLLQLLRQAEAGHYAYVIRNDARHLEAYNASVSSADRHLESLKELLADVPDQKQRLEEIDGLVQEKLRIMSAVVQEHRQDSVVNEHLEDFGRLDQITTRIAELAAAMEADENRLMAEREELAERTASRTRIVMLIGIGLAIAIACVTRVVFDRDLKVRRKGEQLVEQLQLKARVDGQLSQMTNLLQSCLTPDEASKIISHTARYLFPNEAGTLYVFRNSRNLLEVAAEWGAGQGKATSFAPHLCWALRQGQMHEVDDPEVHIGCAHARYREPYICLPMMAHGEVLALLHVQLNNEAKSVVRTGETPKTLLKVFTEHMALALSNLNLRITLRQQSIRDPLTGLFNRRYLEETLTLETERSKRDGAPFSIIMLDLDHFKRFNDTHGHDAGDAVLQTVGRFLQRHVRGGDIACRYGGEEFTMILPGAGPQVGLERAEQLCEGVRSLRVEFRGQILGPLTLSAGIATYPDHGESGEIIQQAADVALYRAKAEGRDRAVMTDRFADDTADARQLVSG